MTEESLHIPEEILEKVLVGFPVKSLLQLRCVSKSWLSLIDSKRFIETHLQYSTKNPDSAHHRLLISSSSERKKCSLRALLKEPKGTNLSPLGLQISPEFAFPASYCKGLVCVYENGRFRLLNPSTRVSKELPKDPEIRNPKYGFGWDESSGAYKVFAAWETKKGRVYSSKTNSWKTVEDPHLLTWGNEGKFVGGKLHWLRINKEIITSFDLKTEKFGTIEVPVNTRDCYVSLGVVGGCLCFSTEYCYEPKRPFNVWVIKESWEKLTTIHLAEEIPYVQFKHYITRVIGEAANGEILIANGTNLLVYCPRNGVIRHRIEIGCCLEALYVESLVSPLMEISSI